MDDFNESDSIALISVKSYDSSLISSSSLERDEASKMREMTKAIRVAREPPLVLVEPRP